ncbi:MAG: HAD-IIIC family phosphatase [Pseudomonadota bacterium]
MTDTKELISTLRAPGATLTKTLQAVDALEASMATAREVSIGISSNVSIELLSAFLRKHGLLAGLRVRPRMGVHDDPVTDVDQFVREDLQGMVFVPFFDNLMPAFEHQLEHMQAEQLVAKEQDFRARCRLVFTKGKPLPFLFVTAFHRFGRPVEACTEDRVNEVLARFNAALRDEAAQFPNVRVLDTESIVQGIGHAAAFDPRFYFRSTAPYATGFLDELARRVITASRGFNSYFYKALVLDCDNTLWGGVVGEDLLDGIRLDPHGHPGKIFWRVQHDFVSLERQGVLLCLCSKNNPADVDEVLTKHPHAVLRDQHVAARRVNWTDKVSNLKSIAEELNIGLDSLVFLDDSAFECEAVRTALPTVKVFQVPPVLTDYPRIVHEVKELFISGGISSESRSKTQQYRARQEAAQASASYATHEEYLASLDLRVALRLNDFANVARISELTLKSNQFNLTTLRQTVGEIRDRMESPAAAVYSLTVEDRFGSAGLTGVVLMSWQGEVAVVDAFLMSCRVIGRGVEFSVWAEIARAAAERGCTFIEAEYRPTAKNTQVADFYDKLGLPLVKGSDGVKRYRSPLASFTPPKTDWIKVTHGQ